MLSQWPLLRDWPRLKESDEPWQKKVYLHLSTKGMKLIMYHISLVISSLQNGLMVLELHPILLSHLSPASLNLLLL